MLGRIIVLCILILVLAGGGIVWFDYLNIIDARSTLAPLHRLLGRQPRVGPPVGDDEFINLDAERLALRLEAHALRELDMDRRQAELDIRLVELELIAQQLEQERRILDEMEISINDARISAETIARNVEGVSRRLTGMPPVSAVAIIMNMTDENAVSVLRMTEEIAQREGTGNLVPFWLSLMAGSEEGALRAAEMQRLMVLDF